MWKKTNSITVRCFAKINISLNVLGTYPGGYHEIDSVFQSLHLHDLLTVTLRDSGLEMTCSDPGLPVDSNNLVMMAAESFFDISGITGGAAFHLEKNIPYAAGLGGGSSDAAAAIKALDMLHGSTCREEQLHQMAREVGSDVPYFLMGGTARVQGRGEILNPMDEAEKLHFVLISPGIKIAASKAYGYYDLTMGTSIGEYDRQGQGHGPDGHVDNGEWHNDLEMGVFQKHPELILIKNRLLSLGTDYSIMSGSGSVVAGACRSRTKAHAIAAQMETGQHPVIITESCSREEFRDKFILQD